MLNKRKHFHRTVIAVSLLISLFASVSLAQTKKEFDDFQNKQRALSLSFYKNSIKSIKDVSIRCFARRQIVEFIFKKKVKEHYDTAERFAIDCLEDLKKNPEQKSGFDDVIKGRIIQLLRANLPETAKIVEKKYAKESDSLVANFIDADSKEGATRLVDKFVKKLQKGEKPNDVEFLLFRMKKTHPKLSIILLDSLLKFYEKLPINENYDRNFMTVGLQFTEKSIPVEIKKRYFSLVLKLGQKSILADMNSSLFRIGFSMLKWSLPQIKEMLPESYQQAVTIYTTLEGRYSNLNREELEIYKRIEESDNKLEQTIFEAKATENDRIKAALWKRATNLAIREKKYRISVDCINKYEYPNDEKFTKRYRIQILTNNILPGVLKEKDFDLATYIVKSIEDFNGKAVTLTAISAAYVKSENQTEALEKLNEALRILDKAENDIHKVRNLFAAARLATKVKLTNSFEIADQAIKTINRLPSPNPEDLLGTKSRNQYVSKILIPNTFNIFRGFNVLAKKDVEYAYSVSQTIQRKDLKLIAEIAVETHKIHPYIPKSETELKK